MCEAMAKLGHDVTLIACCKTKDFSTIYNFYGVNPIFKIRHIELQKGEKTNAAFIFKTIKEIVKIKPDLVYGRILEACFLSALAGFNTCYEAHKFPRQIVSVFSSSLFFHLPKFKRLIVITEALGRMFKAKYNIPKEKIIVAHDGADPIRKSTKQDFFRTENNKFHVGYIGNLYPGKGMELIARLAPKASWASFHIVGGTQDDVIFWKSKLSGVSNVRFYGFVSPAKIESLRKIFHVALLPVQPEVKNNFGTTDTAENISPLKLFEYMASGLPILASDLPSIREVLTTGKNAILLPPSDELAWLRSLEMLRDNKALRKRLGEKAQKDFLRNYTWEARATKVLANL